VNKVLLVFNIAVNCFIISEPNGDNIQVLLVGLIFEFNQYIHILTNNIGVFLVFLFEGIALDIFAHRSYSIQVGYNNAFLSFITPVSY
jgi:hypothetical protein